MQHPPHHRLAVLATWMLLGASATAACTSGGSAPAPTPPPTPTSQASSSSASPKEAAEAQVERSYLAYYAALEQLMASGKPDPAVMADVATPEQAVEDAKAASGLFSSGQHMVGHVQVSVRSVTIEGDRARISACIDGRGWVSVPLAAASPSAGQLGQTPGGAKAEAVRTSDGRWLLASQAATDDPSC